MSRTVKLSAACLESPHPDVTLDDNVRRTLDAVDEGIRQGTDVIYLPHNSFLRRKERRTEEANPE